VTIDVTLNGEPAELDPASTIADVVSAYSPSRTGVAVALNREVVPRSAWHYVHPSSGDTIEILTAAAGG
jgi:sulfur carrier protein